MEERFMKKIVMGLVIFMFSLNIYASVNEAKEKIRQKEIKKIRK